MNVISFTGSTQLVHAVHPGEQAIKLQIAGFAQIPDPNNAAGSLNVPAQLTIDPPGDINTPSPRPIVIAPDTWGQPNTHYRLARTDVQGAEAVLLDTFDGDIQAHYSPANQQDGYQGGGRDNDHGFAVESDPVNGREITLHLHRAIAAGARGDNNVMAAIKAA